MFLMQLVMAMAGRNAQLQRLYCGCILERGVAIGDFGRCGGASQCEHSHGF